MSYGHSAAPSAACARRCIGGAILRFRTFRPDREAHVSRFRTHPLQPQAPGVQPRVSRPTCVGRGWGEVRPATTLSARIRGGAETRNGGLARHCAKTRRPGRLGRDSRDGRTYQRGSSGVVYAVT